MLTADTQTLAGVYPYTLWTTPWNQEDAMFTADRQTLARLQALIMTRDYVRGVTLDYPLLVFTHLADTHDLTNLLLQSPHLTLDASHLEQIKVSFHK